MYKILKEELNSPSKFKAKFMDYIQNLMILIQNNYQINFDDEEFGDLLLSACRSNDFNVVNRQGNRMFLDEEKVLDWLDKKLLPNTIIIRLDDEDIVRLLIFCIEITYQMFAGGTKATVTAKGFRERRRTFESILVDQFVGKLGEVMVKKFLENNFPVKIELDWKISRQIEEYGNDIINAKKKVSIKSSPTLTGIWWDANVGYDYGIAVKCSIPQQPILQFFIEVCGFTRLLDFAENKIPSHDELFRDYLINMKERIKKYKCGEIQTDLKGIICGYFKTKEYKPIRQGISLPYFGEVREERYIVPLNELKWEKNSWKKFLQEVELL
ncbi:MAG: hypothetical protein ACUVQP_04790 [Bacteroidales bacterium]